MFKLTVEQQWFILNLKQKRDNENHKETGEYLQKYSVMES